MLMSPSIMIFLLGIVTSIFIVLSSSSFVISWVGIELNTLMFIPLMLLMKSSRESESTIKYFLIQTLASIILLLGSMLIMNMEFIKVANIMILLSLLVKTGAAPFHSWVPSVGENLNWMSLFLLLTLQKINPLLLISNCGYNFILDWIIILSLLVGAIMGLSQISVRKIMIFSSINHLGWLLGAMKYSLNLMMLYFIIYTVLLMPTIYLFNELSIYNLNQVVTASNFSLSHSFFIFLNLLSLGGLPPFTGFFPKWIVLSSLSMNNNFLIILTMIFMSLITLFYYLRLTYNSFLIHKLNFNIYNKSMKLSPILLMTLSLSLMGFILVYMI